MGLYFFLRRLRMLTPIGTRHLMPQTSAERGGVSGAWLRQKYKPTFKRESSAPLNFVASCAELRFLARVDARWCRREKYKQIRRKTLLYAFERRMKACQSAWRRRKYKPTFTPANASNSANHLPLSRIEFAADRSCNYVRELALDNQLVASES